MSLIIDASRTHFVFSAADAVADATLSPDGEAVVFHLTKGFDGTNLPGDAAFRVAAHAPFIAGRDDVVEDWTFGFRQVARVNHATYTYAGRTAEDGGLVIKPHLPPALPKPVLPDRRAGSPAPWYDDPALATSVRDSLIHCAMGDHPAFKLPTCLPNAHRGNAPNYLFHVLDDIEFWTVLASRDPHGTFRHHLHFQWRIVHDVTFAWRAGTGAVAGKASRFCMDREPRPGAPDDEAVAAALDAKDLPFAGDAQSEALTLSVLGAGGRNRVELTRHPDHVPADFWT